jgi:hypothetical protein
MLTWGIAEGAASGIGSFFVRCPRRLKNDPVSPREF